MKTRKKRLLIILVSIVLVLALTAGVLCGIAYYRNYHEVAIPSEKFLDYPDGITVHYTEGDRSRSKKLSDEEIALVYAAFEALLPRHTGASTVSRGMWRDEWILNNLNSRGGVEFHYDQRRYVSCFFKDPAWQEGTRYNGEMSYGFSGDCDSVLIGYTGSADLKVVGCRNGEYFGGWGSVEFSDEDAGAFWAVVSACVA